MTLTNATCDQCDTPVRAPYIVSLPSGRYLTFCGHHARENWDALIEKGAYIAEADEIVV
jgi:hypothetical protein